MSEAMTELEKLKNAVHLIEDVSMGRLEVCAGQVKCFYIRSDPDSYMGVNAYIQARPSRGCYDITFSAGMVRTAGHLDARGIHSLMIEAQQTHALLTALELLTYRPTHEDLEKFQAFLLERQEQGHMMQLQM